MTATSQADTSASGSASTTITSYTVLHSFVGQDGDAPNEPLVPGANGNLYGLTGAGGPNNDSGACSIGCGTAFMISPSGSGMVTTLYSFCSQSNCADGSYPNADLVQATDGNFYGTTRVGGTTGCGGAGCGTVFKITPSGALTTLYSFCSKASCTDGSYPSAGLVQATDGNFYGTTTTGGADNHGTIFKMSPSGVLTTLYSFCSQNNCTDGYAFTTSGEGPVGRLVEASDGNFYGTTGEGGANGDGVVFRLSGPGSAAQGAAVKTAVTKR